MRGVTRYSDFAVRGDRAGAGRGSFAGGISIAGGDPGYPVCAVTVVPTVAAVHARQHLSAQRRHAGQLSTTGWRGFATIARGQFEYSKTDLALPAPMPIAISRTYRSRDQDSWTAGYKDHRPDRFMDGPAPAPDQVHLCVDHRGPDLGD